MTAVTVVSLTSLDQGFDFDSGDFVTQADPLTVVQLDPAAGSVLTQSPSTLTVTFNFPIDPFSLGMDFVLSRVNADGSLTPLDPSILSEGGGFGPPSSSIVLTVNQQLLPGQYKLSLSGFSTLSGMSGDGPVFWSPPGGFGTDTVLGGFSVVKPGVTLADATDLGVVGPAPVVLGGTLDLQADLSSVALYKFTLAPGHFWRFGAETWTNRIGSPLAATLSLFDSDGRLIRTSFGGAGSPVAPNFFAGLQPGTYYIGVSGSGNVPGAPGGYDPVTGMPGSGVPQTGGTFQLDLAAVPADAPTRVRGFQLQWADPLSTTPTGFTLAFSAPLDLGSFAQGTSPVFDGLEVVDQSGKVWNVTPVAYQESTGQFTFLFNERLPAGQYFLRLPAQGGITDLAGQAPVAPGLRNGVLATWRVTSDPRPRDPHDLGALNDDALAGLDLSNALSPGDSVTYRMVVLAPGIFKLQTLYAGGPVSIQLTGPNGTTVINAGNPGELLHSPMNLSPGVYTLTLTASGTEPVQLSALLKESFIQWESLIENGVGQGPALNLLFLTPVAPPGGGTTPGEPALTPPPPSPGGGSPSPSAGPALPAPGGLVLSVGGFLAGTLGPMAGQTTGSTLTGLSSTTAGVEISQQAAPTVTARVGESVNGSLTAVSSSGSDAAEVTLAASGALSEELLPVDLAVDAQVVAESEWVGRVGERLAHWFSLAPETAPDPVDPPAAPLEPSPERIALQRDDLPAPEPERVDRADFNMPLGLGLISVLTLGFQRPVRRWWRGRAKRTEAQGPGSVHQGPHRKI